ncbi:MAG: hypothetical protein ACUVT6_11355 [Thermodesulfobacteriota bacterium]
MERFYNMRISLLILLIIFLFPMVVLPNEVIKTKGILMEIDLKNNILIINEEKFTWDSNTVIEDEKGSNIKINNLKPNTPIYMESVEDPGNKRFLIKKIRLIKKVK